MTARARGVRSPPPRGPARWLALRRLGVLSLVVLLLVGAVQVGRWYLRTRSLQWQVRRAFALLDQADSRGTVHEALAQWERETRPAWEPRRDEFIAHLFTRADLADARVRLLLSRVAGADYGDRRADWERWYQTRQRLRAGQPPTVSRSERIKLEPRWSAPIGLTGWFTTILPMDGAIYVASLGADFDDAQDPSDGIVRVDGMSGTSELIFTPPSPIGRGPRDVIGIAAGTNCMYAGCANGFVYCVEPGGQLRWETHVASAVEGPPLSIDFNDDGTDDVVVITRNAEVVALSGKTGRTVWVAKVGDPPAGASLLGATLTLGDVLAGQGDEIVATTPRGDVAVIAARNGRLRWQTRLDAGSLAGAVCRASQRVQGPPVYVGDSGAWLWSLVHAGQSLEAVYWGTLTWDPADTQIAGLRTLRSEPEGQPILIACSTGEYERGRAAVSALSAVGAHWRLPIDGAVWGTPAIADLNGDRQLELVVAAITPGANGDLRGAFNIVSHAGHLLKRHELEAPIECSPVVADVDGDNLLEILVADQAGRLHCFATTGYGPVVWGLHAGDSHNTRNADHAYSWGQAPFGYQRQWRPAPE